MKLAYFTGKSSVGDSKEFASLLSRLKGGIPDVHTCTQTSEEDLILSAGGDGTFLEAARIAAVKKVPLLGVNFGRLGFLSGNTPDEVAEALPGGNFTIEHRTMLKVRTNSGFEAVALNEVSVHRSGAAMLGVHVEVGDDSLPVYWGDGVLVSTSSGSTAYNLSVGGPICSPDTGVFIIAPIAPHNLNVRPLLVPETSRVRMTLKLRDTDAILSADNCAVKIGEGTEIEVEAAPEKLQVARLGGSNFIQALCSRLLWGDDVRNSK